MRRLDPKRNERAGATFAAKALTHRGPMAFGVRFATGLDARRERTSVPTDDCRLVRRDGVRCNVDHGARAVEKHAVDSAALVTLPMDSALSGGAVSTYPQAPIAPHAVQKLQPSLRMTA